MNEPPSFESDFQETTPEPKIDQNVENSQGVNQQSAVGDSNHQNIETAVNQQPDVGKGDNQNQDLSRGISKQSIEGDKNIQNHSPSSANATNNINFYLHTEAIKNNAFSGDSQKESSETEDFVDPTKPLPRKPKKTLNFEQNQLQDYYQKLKEDHLIIVSCIDQDVAWEAAYALAEMVKVSNKRLLTAERRSLNNFDELSIDTILEPKIGEGESTLIVVEPGEKQTFLDSLIVNRSTAEDIKNDLENSHKLCICLSKPEILEKTLESKKVKPFFPCWEIPSQSNSDDKKSVNDQVDVISLFEKGNTLTQTVLYVAVFFEKLNLREFERVVLLLLGNQTCETEERKVAVNQKSNDSEPVISFTIDDQNITVNRYNNTLERSESPRNNLQAEKLLSEVWQDNSDEILKSCYLKYLKTEHSSRFIDFSLPDMRQQLIDYFQEEKYGYCRKNFRSIIELDLVFNTSSQVTISVVKMSINMMLDSPDEYDSQWLTNKILDAIKSIDEAKTEKELKQELNHIFTCVSYWLREILNYPELDGLVAGCLEKLISEKQHDAVLEIVKSLRFAPEFNEIYWIKQLLQRKEVGPQTYKFLYNQLKQSGSRVYEILSQIQNWLPKVEAKQYSLLHKYALQLLPEYILETSNKFDQKFYGKQAFKYRLFSSLRNDNDAQNKLNLLARWLLHPGIEEIINPDENIDSLDLLTSIILSLFTILYGLENNHKNSEIEPVANGLIIALNNAASEYQKITGKNYHKLLLERWELWSSNLLELCNDSMSSKDWKQEKFFNAQRNILRRLSKEFRALANQ